jgi:EAL domain-containing protein (putative c-di-GMP-specific phosphodiesterase class I)
METLKEIGCLFSLDDFGTGMSSFTYLKNLPVDYLKIDGYFVKTMMEDKIDHAMVASIHQIGSVMGLKTIAEFVENEEIYNELKAMGVDCGQGNAIGKPELFI